MSKLSEQGQAILEEVGLIIKRGYRFDKRMKTDPETGDPIPTMRFDPPRRYDGIILVYHIGIRWDPSAGLNGGSLACSPVFRNKHDLRVWAAKNESTIREEFSDASN